MVLLAQGSSIVDAVGVCGGYEDQGGGGEGDDVGGGGGDGNALDVEAGSCVVDDIDGIHVGNDRDVDMPTSEGCLAFDAASLRGGIQPQFVASEQ